MILQSTNVSSQRRQFNRNSKRRVETIKQYISVGARQLQQHQNQLFDDVTRQVGVALVIDRRTFIDVLLHNSSIGVRKVVE